MPLWPQSFTHPADIIIYPLYWASGMSNGNAHDRNNPLRFFASRARIPELKRSRWQVPATRAGLARYWLFQFSDEKFEDLLLALLHFEQDRLGHSGVILARMDLARLQEDSPQIGDASLRKQHLVVGLNHGSFTSTVPRFPKLLVTCQVSSQRSSISSPMETRAHIGFEQQLGSYGIEDSLR